MKALGPQVQEKENLLKRMDKNLEKRIASKEREIESIDQEYDQRIADAKTEGEKDYLRALDQNQKKVVDQSNVFEEKIQNYQTQLAHTRDLVEREEKNLKQGQQLKIDQMNAQFEDDFHDRHMDITEGQREIQASTQNALAEMSAKSKAEKTMAGHQAEFEMNALTSDLNRKAVENESNFRAQMENNARMQREALRWQKSELQKAASADFEKNKRMEDEKGRVQKEQMLFLDKHQKNLLKQREDDFKVRYEKIVNEHNTILKNISDEFDADVKKIVERSSMDKKIIEDRNNDSFYRIEKLSPHIENREKDIIVSLPVAPHEKENVHLSAQGRNLKITLSRKYSEKSAAEDGSINKSTRSELYSKELDVPDIMDSQGMTQKYEDGILSFKVKKA